MGVLIFIYFTLPILTVLTYVADMKKTASIFLLCFFVMSVALFS